MRGQLLSRRRLLQSVAGWPAAAFLRERPQDGGRRTVSSRNLAVTLAQFLNRTRFDILPPKAIEHAKMIIASTLASASPGSRIDSARIVRELAKERGGKPEARIWFDGTKLPVDETARVNAMLSDAAASDDSTCATWLTQARL
jgi:2-methylcitrate dehydratase PrpD